MKIKLDFIFFDDNNFNKCFSFRTKMTMKKMKVRKKKHLPVKNLHKRK